MEIHVKSTDRNLLLEIQGELDHHGAKNALRELEMAIDAALPVRMVMDLAGVTFMDSSGIGVIMGRYRMVYLLGGEVWAVHANERMKKILTMSGVTKIIQIYEEEEV